MYSNHANFRGCFLGGTKCDHRQTRALLPVGEAVRDPRQMGAGAIGAKLR